MAYQPKPRIKKQRITILLDEEVVNAFKMIGEKECRPYQPIMNRVLREYLTNIKPSVDA